MVHSFVVPNFGVPLQWSDTDCSITVGRSSKITTELVCKDVVCERFRYTSRFAYCVFLCIIYVCL